MDRYVYLLYKCDRKEVFPLKVNVLVREDDKLDIPEFEDIFAYMVSNLAYVYALLHWFKYVG